LSVVKWRHDRRYHRPHQNHLDDVKPAVLRRIEVPFDTSARLAAPDHSGMGWTNSHLYELRAGGVGWKTDQHKFESGLDDVALLRNEPNSPEGELARSANSRVSRAGGRPRFFPASKRGVNARAPAPAFAPVNGNSPAPNGFAAEAIG
jgi:hypothetical protein